MNEKAEQFRRITMKVLTMQLNSVSVMDIVAYAGSAVGVVIAIVQVENGTITLPQAFLIIMLAADFFCRFVFWVRFPCSYERYGCK